MSNSIPEVTVGTVVYYYAHENAEPVMAFVTKVGRDAHELWALSPGYGGVPKPSVRYKDDPRLATSAEWKQYGTWGLMPRDSRIAQLSERLSLLERKWAELAGENPGAQPAKPKALAGNK